MPERTWRLAVGKVWLFITMVNGLFLFFPFLPTCRIQAQGNLILFWPLACLIQELDDQHLAEGYGVEDEWRAGFSPQAGKKASPVLPSEVVCHSLFQWTTFCQTSPPWPVHLGWPHTSWLSFTELVRKGKVIGYWKRNSTGQYVPNMLLEMSREITPERMKGWSQNKNNTQLRMDWW